MPDISAFVEDLRQLVNKHSLEGLSGMPDFVIAAFMWDSYETLCASITATEEFLGLIGE